MELKNLLNDMQYKAAVHENGPLLILAGAGSGKTRVLTHRIAHLVENCFVEPYNIIAITFTNKAAREMAERVTDLLGGDIRGMWISTFHSACGRILRRDGERIGFTSNFIIYDESESLTVIKDCMKKLDIDEKRIPAKSIKSIISKAKDQILSPDDYEKSIDYRDINARKVAQLYKMYQTTLLNNNAMDFDDMVLHVLRLFKENPDVLEYYQNRFKYILVDEYQDTNRAQYLFVTMLAAKYRNLCVVGDDDQSIYSFRGADVSNILDFEKDYPECVTIKLEQNYRSTQNILDAANSVIKNNRMRKAKALWTASGAGARIVRVEANDNNEEGYFIAREIKRAVEDGNAKYSDYTILYRVNALSQSVENAMIRMSIPYKVYGGMKFFDRKEIKDIVAYLRVFDNPMDEIALRRIINVPKRGIGATSIERAAEIAAREEIPLFAVFSSADSYPELSRAASAMSSFATHVSEEMFKKDDMPISEFIEFLLEDMGLLAEYRAEKTEESKNRIENLMEFISVAKEFENEQRELEGGDESSFTAFLESIALSSDLDKKDDSDDCVTLMTIHNAKGLEFPTVFVVGMEEGLFPSDRTVMETEDGIDEERRLCYVAITRAKEKLYLMNSRSRMLYGRTTYNMPSRFLKEIPDELFELSSFGATGMGSVQRGAFGSSYTSRSDDGYQSKGYGRNAEGFGYRTGKSDYGYGKSSYGSNYSGAVSGKKPSFGKAITSASDVGNLADSLRAKSQPNMPKKTGGDKNYKTGDRVFHKKFGEGTVGKLEESNGRTVIEISFDNTGVKRFVLDYVELSRI